MPMYEYVCQGCQEEFEELVFSSDEQVDCPKCKGNQVQKKVSRFAFKSGGNFVSTASSSCSSCSPGPGGCSGCGGH